MSNWRDLDAMPTVYGVREAAAFLGMPFATLKVAGARKGSYLAPDRAIMRAGKRSPGWSEPKLLKIKKRRKIETEPFKHTKRAIANLEKVK